MKIAFDTNVLLDAFLRRLDFQAAQALIMAVAAEDDITGIVTANSITDIYYIARKAIGDKKARDVIADILRIFSIAVIDGEVCAKALASKMDDFEDAVLAICAQNQGADYIASRDKAFAESPHCPVRVMYPDEMLGILRLKRR